jgi:hypothetical protein
MSYPNGLYLVSPTEVKALANISVATYDAFINAYIPAVQDAIEVYLDRRLMKNVWNEWFAYDRALILPQWPVNTIMFLGTPVNCVQVVDNANRYSFDIKQTNGTNPTIEPKLTVIDGFTLVQKDYLFSTYTSVATLVAAVQADYIASLVLTISTSPTYDFNSMNTLSLRAGTGLNWYGAIRQNVLYRIDDETNRTLIIPQNVIVQFNALDYWFEVSINVVWDAGYTQAQVPQTLKLVASNIISDLMRIYDVQGSGLSKNIYKSELLGDYSYTLDPSSKISELILTKYAGMLAPYRKLIC